MIVSHDSIEVSGLNDGLSSLEKGILYGETSIVPCQGVQ